MRLAVLVALMPAFVSAETHAARAADCDTLLHLRGYLTVATVKCGFTEASNVIDQASACRSKAGKAEATRIATDGIRFAQGEMVAKGGTATWCGFVKSQYPSLVAGKAK